MCTLNKGMYMYVLKGWPIWHDFLVQWGINETNQIPLESVIGEEHVLFIAIYLFSVIDMHKWTFNEKGTKTSWHKITQLFYSNILTDYL